MTLCECGCGETVNPGRRFINGHQNRGKDYLIPKPEPKLCKCGCGEYANPGNDYINHHQFNNQNDRDEASERSIQYHIDHPEHGKEHSEWMLQYYIDNPDVSKNHGEQVIRYYIDYPEAREELSRKKIQFHVDHPDARDAAREKSIEQWSSQETRDITREKLLQFHKDHPEAAVKQSKRLIKFHKDYPEAAEKQSARLQGQDYDIGQWTGFVDYNRNHLKPESQCVKLNERFDGCEGHHMTPSVMIYIPRELHRHIGHNMKTGENVGKMNMLVLQYLHGCYND